MFQMPENFDTAALADRGATLEVEGPDGVVLRDATGQAVMTITLQGADSAAYRAAERRNLNKRLAKRHVKMTAEELEAESISILADVTTGWSGFKGLDGQPIPCNRTNAVALFTRYAFIREQADRFINERANFLPKPVNASLSS